MDEMASSQSKYAHYATPDPDFDRYKDMESPFASIDGLSVPAMREIASTLPVSFPYDETTVTSSVVVRHQQIQARDGAELDLRIYTDQSVGAKAILFFVTHGGGMYSYLTRFLDHSCVLTVFTLRLGSWRS